ncbi:CaiB/BaiF CoA transferase family protein [Streptomyces sp. NPDC051018]|uniref:CaiB/BaiF CoA transferase family protein n=1 Tax=Streptomyces sp. NPDC051018 TaxID=3365639 RepID=UPI00379F34BC
MSEDGSAQTPDPSDPVRLPLDGIRVIDLTTTFMGPYATMLLGGLGADVIKVELPQGDVARYVGPRRHNAMGPVFLNANHGKRSIAMDLTTEAAKEVLGRLIASADVFLTNMRPAARAKLGLESQDVMAVNPGIVYCTMNGFGQDGPYRDLAAYDDVIQAMCGLASVQGGPGGSPAYVKTAIADKLVGVFGFGALLAGLFARERTGEGQIVEVPMFETMVTNLAIETQGGTVFDPPTGPPGYPRSETPYRRPYATADGHLAVLPYTDRQWHRFFELIGKPELCEDERFDTIGHRTVNADELYRMLEAEIAGRTSAEWMRALTEAGIAHAPVLTVTETLEDPHSRAVGLFRRREHPTEGGIRVSRIPMRFGDRGVEHRRLAPVLGEHGREVLTEAGYDTARIQELLDAEVVVEPANAPAPG